MAEHMTSISQILRFFRVLERPNTGHNQAWKTKTGTKGDKRAIFSHVFFLIHTGGCRRSLVTQKL